MIDVSSIQTLDHELARVTEVFANSQSFLIDILSSEILRHTTVISVT